MFLDMYIFRWIYELSNGFYFFQRIVCVLLAATSARSEAEKPHAGPAPGDHAAVNTIYRETVASPQSHALFNDASYSTHSEPIKSHVGPILSNDGLVNDGASALGYYGPVISHPSNVISHRDPVVSHNPVLSQGTPTVVGKSLVSHDGLLNHSPAVHTPVISVGSKYQEPVRSQYHAQDHYGQYSFGYNAGTSARDETRDAYGNVRGSFSYIDSYGNLQTQHYVAGKGGFRVEGTNLPVQVSHGQRHKRSYATFPASTGPLVGGIPSSHTTTVTRHEQGPVVVGHSTPYGSPHGHGASVVYQPPVLPSKGLALVNAYEVSPLLGNANLHGNFEKYGYNGFSYGFETGPSSLTTYGTHFNQHIPTYSH